MSFINEAYKYGSALALQEFEKLAQEDWDWGDYLVPATAGIAGPIPAGLAGAVASPEGRRFEHGTAALGGSAIGGLLGALGGGGLGYGAGKLLDVDPRVSAGIGALLGQAGGSAYGTHLGRQYTKRRDLEKGAGVSRDAMLGTAEQLIPGLAAGTIGGAIKGDPNNRVRDALRGAGYTGAGVLAGSGAGVLAALALKNPELVRQLSTVGGMLGGITGISVAGKRIRDDLPVVEKIKRKLK